MILVTGAAGKTGQAILRALSKRGVQARALVRRETQCAAALSAGATEAFSGDIAAPADLAAAMRGARAVYHICPNMHPGEIEIGETALQAARSNGVELFVYHSVLHPQTEAMPHHWKKMRVEELILQSGLDFTILQPCAYMQNIMGYWNAIRREGVYAVPYATSAKISCVDLDDVAEAAAVVLTAEGHGGATYELAGPEALSPDDMAAVMTQALGRPVTALAQDRAAWAERVRAAGMAPYEIDTLLKMFEFYEKYHFRGNPRALQCVLGKPPRSFGDMIRLLAAGDPSNG